MVKGAIGGLNQQIGVLVTSQRRHQLRRGQGDREGGAVWRCPAPRQVGETLSRHGDGAWHEAFAELSTDLGLPPSRLWLDLAIAAAEVGPNVRPRVGRGLRPGGGRQWTWPLVGIGYDANVDAVS